MTGHTCGRDGLRILHSSTASHTSGGAKEAGMSGPARGAQHARDARQGGGN